METLESKPVPLQPPEAGAVAAHNCRVGVILFFAYVIFYGGFMVLSAFWPETMGEPFLGGVNLAVVYGLSLILIPLVLALVYMKLCRKPGSPGA